MPAPAAPRHHIPHHGARLIAITGPIFITPQPRHTRLNPPWRSAREPRPTGCTWPDAAGRALSVTVGPQDPHLFSPWGQFAVFAAYTLGLLVIGAVLFVRHDA